MYGCCPTDTRRSPDAGLMIGRRPIINPFKPEFTIVIFIHYKPRIAAAILDL